MGGDERKYKNEVEEHGLVDLYELNVPDLEVLAAPGGAAGVIVRLRCGDGAEVEVAPQRRWKHQGGYGGGG
jgi:hypothetical protein